MPVEVAGFIFQIHIRVGPIFEKKVFCRDSRYRRIDWRSIRVHQLQEKGLGAQLHVGSVLLFLCHEKNIYVIFLDVENQKVNG
jgi:hypothetical protein